MSAVAWAKPKIAVVPLSGDTGNKLSLQVAEALGDDFSVLSFKALAKITKKTTVDDDLAAKIEKQGPAVVVVSGKLIKVGSNKKLQLKIAVKGADTADLVVKLKGNNLDDDGKTKIHDAVQKLAVDDDDDKPKKHHEEPKEEPKEEPRHAISDEPKKRDPDEDRPKKKKDLDEDKPQKKEKRVASEDDDTKITKKHHKRDDDEAAGPRAVHDIFLDLGAAYGMRQLTYDSASPTPPPKVSTAAPSVRIAGEGFFKAAGATGALANFGIGFEYDKAFGLSIALGMTSVPIDQGHLAFGARYKLDIATASVIVLGLDYASRHYIADRSGLTAASQLDAPDTDYSGAQVDVEGRTPFTDTIQGFAKLQLMLPFSAGQIQNADSYGPATVYGIGLDAGVDIAVAKNIAVRLVGEAEQIGLSFKGTGAQSQARMVSSATDRQLGLVASLGLFY